MKSFRRIADVGLFFSGLFSFAVAAGFLFHFAAEKDPRSLYWVGGCLVYFFIILFFRGFWGEIKSFLGRKKVETKLFFSSKIYSMRPTRVK